MRPTPFLRISAGALLLLVSSAAALCEDSSFVYDTPGLSTSNTGQIADRDMEAGENAMKSGDYKTAADYFEKSKLRANLANDEVAYKNALSNELHACISADLAERAQKLLDEAIKNNEWKKDDSDLYQAQIYLIQRRYDDAKALLSSLEINTNPTGIIQKRFCDAAIAEYTGDNDTAIQIYRETILSSGRKSMLGGRAAERMILLLAEKGETESARSEQKLLFEARSDGKSTSRRNNDANRIFLFYCDLVSNAVAMPSEQWDEIRKAPHPDEFFCRAACRIADHFVKAKEYRYATEAYYLAQQSAPVKEDAINIQLNILAVYNAVGNPALAAEYAEYMLTLFQLSDLNSDSVLRIAKILLVGGKKKAGLDLCINLLKPLQDEELITTYTKALNDILVGTKSYTEAKQLIETAGSMIPGRTMKNAFDYAHILELELKYDEARKKYDEILNTPDFDQAGKNEALRSALLCSVKLNSFEDVVGYGEKLRKAMPDDVDVLNYMAIAEEKLKRYGDAYAHFREYAEKIPADNPKHDSLVPYAYYRAASNAVKTGDNKDASDVLRILTDRYSEAAEYNDAMLLLIQTLFRQDNSEEALLKALTFSSARKTSAQAREALLFAARQLFSAGDYPHTEDCLKNLRKADDAPDFQLEAYYLSIRIAMMDRYSKEASDLVKEMAELVQKDSPYEPVLHFLQGEIFRRSGSFDKARAEYKAVLDVGGQSSLKHAARNAVGDSYFEEASMMKEQSSATSADTGALTDGMDSKKTSTYKKALAEYKALSDTLDTGSEIKAMALYKTAKTSDIVGKGDDARNALEQLLPLCKADEADLYPQTAIWVARGAALAEDISLKKPDYNNTHLAEKGLLWLGTCGKISRATMDERLQKIRNLLQYKTLPQSQTTQPDASAQTKKGDES